MDTQDPLDEIPETLVNSEALSTELVAICNRFEHDLFDWLARAALDQARTKRVALKSAVLDVTYVLTDKLLYPTYLHHPRIVPPELGQPPRTAIN